MTDKDSLRRKPWLHAWINSFTPVYNTCMHVCLGATGWSSGAAWLMTAAAQSPRAASRCSSPPFSVPISPVLLQTGHSFPAPKIPQFSPHVPCQSVQCRPQASCTGLTSPKACAAQRIDFISPPSHFISFISRGFMSNCELDREKKKLNWYYL